MRENDLTVHGERFREGLQALRVLREWAVEGEGDGLPPKTARSDSGLRSPLL